MIDIERLGAEAGGPSGRVDTPAVRPLNVPEPMVGYAQLSRTAEQPDQVWQRLVATAARYCGYLQRFVYDPEPSAEVSRPLVEQQLCIPMWMPPWMVEIATGAGSVPGRPLATLPNSAFWKLVVDLHESGGVVVTLSIDHLDFLGPTRVEVLQWLSRSRPPIDVLFDDISRAPDHPERRVTDSVEPSRSTPSSEDRGR